jgi:WD40 repeat protein
MKQWSLSSKQLLVESPLVHDYMISTMTLGENNKLWTGGSFGEVKQFCLATNQIIHNLGEVHESSITILKVEKYGTVLWTGSSHGDLKIWNISANQAPLLMKDLGELHENGIYSFLVNYQLGMFWTGGKDKI